MIIFLLAELPDYGSWACEIVSKGTSILPHSPITLAQVADSFEGTFLGGGIPYVTLNSLTWALSPIVFWKLYKILPFKS